MAVIIPTYVYFVTVLYCATVACYCIAVMVTGPGTAMFSLDTRNMIPSWALTLFYFSNMVMYIGMTLVSIYSLFVCLLLASSYLQIERSTNIASSITYFVTTVGRGLFISLAAMVFGLPSYAFMTLTGYFRIYGTESIVFNLGALFIGALLIIIRFPLIQMKYPIVRVPQ